MTKPTLDSALDVSLWQALREPGLPEVTDTEPLVTSTPTGTVGFTSDGAGSFDATRCTLSGSGASAHCSVTYTPSPPGGAQTVTAVYFGDALHVESVGSGAVRAGLRSASAQRAAASSFSTFVVSECTAPGPRPPFNLPSAASAGSTPSLSAALRSALCSTRNFATSV